MTPSSGQVIGGKYRLDLPIARGGMGSVWSATHVQLGTKLAIKFMEPGLALVESARARFEREARAAAQLKSPHIVQVVDHGIDGDLPYIAMELLEGEDLGTRLAREFRLPLAVVSKLVTQAAKGLQRAHDEGIVHRDIKPRNLFLARARADEEEVVKILDFGVAKVMGNQAGDTKTGELIGSPHFMSPEQAHGGKEVDHRSDLWSLGVIAFRALTGERPFQGDGMGDVLVKIVTGNAPTASSVASELSPEVDRFFEVALARDPSKRFQSAREMADALHAIATGTTPLSMVLRPADGNTPLEITSGEGLPPPSSASAPLSTTRPTATPTLSATPTFLSRTLLTPTVSGSEPTREPAAEALALAEATLAGTGTGVRAKSAPRTTRNALAMVGVGAAIVVAFLAGRSGGGSAPAVDANDAARAASPSLATTVVAIDTGHSVDPAPAPSASAAPLASAATVAPSAKATGLDARGHAGRGRPLGTGTTAPTTQAPERPSLGY